MRPEGACPASGRFLLAGAADGSALSLRRNRLTTAQRIRRISAAANNGCGGGLTPIVPCGTAGKGARCAFQAEPTRAGMGPASNPVTEMTMPTRCILALALMLSVATLAGSALAADFSPDVSAPAETIAVPAYVPPVQSNWNDGRRWHGHHDWDWSQDPHHAYATYGWKQPWSYAPRTLPYGEYRPRVVMPTPVEPGYSTGARPAWTAQWYQYCASRYRSFDRDTGTYTTYSGRRQVCR